MIHKCFLDCRQLGTFLHTFYGENFAAICLDCGENAGVYALSVHKDGTCAAIAFAAAFLGTGKTQLFTQHMKQRFCRINLDSM